MKIETRIILTILTLISLSGFSQTEEGISVSTNSIIDSISTSNIVEGWQTGLVPLTPKVWRFYNSLEDTATINELYQLTDSKNPVVRCYSFMALIHRSDSLAMKVLRKSENDSSNVRSANGCVIVASTVFQFQLSRVRPYFTDNQPEIDQTYLNDLIKKNKEILNSLYW